MLAEGLVKRPDGRVVAWAEWGDPQGKPLRRSSTSPRSSVDRVGTRRPRISFERQLRTLLA